VKLIVGTFAKLKLLDPDEPFGFVEILPAGVKNQFC
jgi:hypothetical protein